MCHTYTYAPMHLQELHLVRVMSWEASKKSNLTYPVEAVVFGLRANGHRLADGSGAFRVDETSSRDRNQANGTRLG